MSGSVQVCAACGNETPETDFHTRCPHCRGLLEVRHQPPVQRGPALRATFDARWGIRRGPLASGVWRYCEAVMPTAGDSILSYPEGNTPLLAHATVARWTGVRGAGGELWLKHEGQNPTGSFKDRGMTVGVTQARRVKARAVACASTGNTAASLAAYAALAGLPALVLVPKGQVALGKLAQALAYGARTLLVRGNFDDCRELADQASDRLGVYLLNSVNPFRLEGQKTIVLELLQQLEWVSPDWITVPAGNLGNTAAFGKALEEARVWGLIDRVPRLAAIQADGAAPFAQSFQTRFVERRRVEPHTLASAINIGNPVSYDRAVRAIRDTRGVVTSVSDDDILEAKAVVDGAGIGCEPASAAALAGTRRLISEGVIGEGDRVVAVLTGHVLKDPEIVIRYHEATEPRPARANRPIEIDARLSEVERAMSA
jgi:threonine synthase